MDATCKLHNLTHNPLAWWMLLTSQSHKTSDTLWNSIPVVVWYNFCRLVNCLKDFIRQLCGEFVSFRIKWKLERSRRPTWLNAMRRMMEENERDINPNWFDLEAGIEMSERYFWTLDPPKSNGLSSFFQWKLPFQVSPVLELIWQT